MNKKHLSASSLNAFLQCPRRFFYAHELGWKPETEASALTFGRAWHSFLEYITASHLDELGEQVGFTERVYMFTGDKKEELASLSPDNLALLMAMMNTYARTFYEIGLVRESEKKFVFRLPHSRWSVKGFIDAVDFYGNPIEYKTTSSDIADGSFYWLRLKANIQAVTYALALKSNKVTYAVARKPSLKRKQVPLTDENGCKIVTDIATGERVYNKNGTPRQTGGEGLQVESREETQEEFTARMEGEIIKGLYYTTKSVDISDDDKWSALQAYTITAKQIDLLRRQAKIATRIDLPWTRNCTEFNCKNCPYQGICLDINYNPSNGIPQGFTK